MTKEQVRKEIHTLNPFEVIKHLGLDSNETQRMMDGVGYGSYIFDYEDRVGFLEWNRDIGDFSSYSVPKFLAEKLCRMKKVEMKYLRTCWGSSS